MQALKFLLVLFSFAFLQSARASDKQTKVQPALFLMDKGIDMSMVDVWDSTMGEAEEVDLLIDSDGGLVIAAERLVERMKYKKMVTCYIKKAQSAALEIIMPGCHRRIVMATTLLGFHTAHVQISGNFGAKELLDFGTDLEKTNRELLERLLKSMPKDVKHKTIIDNFYAENQFQVVAFILLDEHLIKWFDRVLVGTDTFCYPFVAITSNRCDAGIK